MNREDEWFQGMNACVDGQYYYKQLMFQYREGELFFCGMFVERMCKRFEHFVLVGAGKRIKNIMHFLRMMDEEDRVEAIMDSNKLLQGTRVCGRDVMSFGQRTKGSCYVITAVSKKTVDEIETQLHMAYGDEIEILSAF